MSGDLINTGLVFLVALMVPGPDFLVVSQTAIARGLKAGSATALGIAFGCLVYAAFALMGLDVLFTSASWTADLLRGLGGAYLIYLALQVWRGAGTPVEIQTVDAPQKSSWRDLLAACRLGLFTNLTNPKAIAFFSSIFALALGPDTTTTHKAALLLMVLAMPVAWFSFVSFVMSRPRFRAQYARLKIYADRGAALIMGFFGLRLILSPLMALR